MAYSTTRSKKNKTNNSISETNEYRGISFYIILICGTIICFAGIFLIITNTAAVGFTSANRFGAPMKGSIVNGWFTLFVGIVFCIIGIYNLPKNRIK